jgi:hypothetical protein
MEIGAPIIRDAMDFAVEMTGTVHYVSENDSGGLLDNRLSQPCGMQTRRAK